MSDQHDPLCLHSREGSSRGACPICAGIDTIRADERERERKRRIDRYDTTTIEEIVSDERERIAQAIEALDGDGIHLFLRPGVSTTHVGLFYPDGSAYVPEPDVIPEDMHLALALDQCWPLIRTMDAARIARDGGQ